MALDELLIVMPNDKNFIITPGTDGLIIRRENDETMTYHELHLMTALSFVYVGAHLKKVLLDSESIFNKGYAFYKGFHKKYKGMKRLDEMTPQEFNEEMKKYDGRSNGNIE